VIDENEYARWLTSEIDSRERYHHHKETMAWVVTALYIPGIIILGCNISGEQCIVKAIISWLIVVAAYLLFCFLNMQFKMRWDAAEVDTVLRQRLIGLYRGGNLPQCPNEWTIKNEDDWKPKFLTDDIEILEDYMKKNKKVERNFKGDLLAFWRLLKFWHWDNEDGKGIDGRWRTELPSYTVIVIATIIALVLIW